MSSVSVKESRLGRGASTAASAWERQAREASRNRRPQKVAEEGSDILERISRRSNASSDAGESRQNSKHSSWGAGVESRKGSKESRKGSERQGGPSFLDDPSHSELHETSLNPMHMKAMAARLRKHLHRDQQRIASHGSYASLEVEGDRAQDPEGHAESAGGTSGGSWAALCSILYHPFTLLLLAFPLGVASHVLGWGALCTFWLNIIALVPLAKILGDGTEELAAALGNDTISGLLNATLGNAVELIVTVQTLRKGLLSVVKATLLGSILSNMLLVLGTSFLLGGLVGSSSHIGKHHVIYDEAYEVRRCTFEKEQIFSAKSALVSISMQLMACMTIALPTVFAYTSADDMSLQVNGTDRKEAREYLLLKVSRISAIIIMCVYLAFISFQLVTHKRMLAIDEGAAESDDEEDEDGGGLSTWAALALMGATTCVIAVSTEMLVGAIEKVIAHAHISANFIGIVLLPFAGNACEHASAIRFAIQDRPGLSIGIAVGSSTQIALFVVPFAVVMGWILDQPMDLVFGMMNTTVMLLSVLVTLVLVIDGRANWLKGFMLCTAYTFEAALFWYSTDA